VGDAQSLPGAFYSQGGAGGDGSTEWAGMHGCNIRDGTAGPQTFSMCETTFRVDAGRFSVLAVNASVAMSWDHMHVGVVEPGFFLRSSDRTMPLDQRVDISAEASPGTVGEVHDLRLDAVLAGDIEPAQGFEVCGAAPGMATVWLRDVRPIGALMGIILDVDGCDGTPWQEPASALPEARAFDLVVTGTQAAGSHSSQGPNCVRIPKGTSYILEATAEWASQSPLTERLELAFADGTGAMRQDGTSPLAANFTAEGEQEALLAVQLAGDAGAAVQQAVTLRLRITYAGEPAGDVEDGIACAIG